MICFTVSYTTRDLVSSPAAFRVLRRPLRRAPQGCYTVGHDRIIHGGIFCLKKTVSDAVIRRLPSYYRYLISLEEQGVVRISSHELAELMGLTASQIRQDINCFGGFGQQGYGYNVKELRTKIGEILGMTRCFDMVLVGAGHIGQAIAKYPYFRDLGLRVVAAFDTDASLVGHEMEGVPIRGISELEGYVTEHKIDIGIIAVPAAAAQETAERLARAGIRAMWNFAPIDLQVGESVSVVNVHLSDSLLVLLYHLSHSKNG